MGGLRTGLTLALALLALAAGATRAGAAAGSGALDGHISFGYGQLYTSGAPGGSIALAAGVDYPLAPSLRLGADIGYDLLGSRNLDIGSLAATVDYSALETLLLLHWLPARLGPVERVSVGPALLIAHGDLSTSGGGAAFEPYAVHESAGGFAAQVTLMSKHESPLRLGLQIGATVGYLKDATWTVAGARLAVHY